MNQLIESPGRVVVVVGDSDRLARVTKALIGAGMDVTEITSLAAARASLQEVWPDLLVTDALRADGEIGRELLELFDLGAPPVIVIAENEVAGVTGLEAGSADYLVEPFLERELAARARLRCRSSEGPVLDRGDLQIDRLARLVFVRGVEVELTRREYDLLEFLATRPAQAFTREQLLEAVWQTSPEWQEVDTVTEHVYRLRQRIEEDPRQPRWLVTVRGTGYRFDS